jgi:serine/tyrosine/threonine adenylyltransferase
MRDLPEIPFDNSYARDLEGFYVPWAGTRAPAPEILRLNKPLAKELGLDAAALGTGAAAAMLSGGGAPEGATPLAMAYAGHQFGGFSPQLGDGRALLLGEVIDRAGHRRDIHLKGAGKTQFSRGGDGKAVLSAVLREYLFGEAMHALGIPTTRALSATLTGETVWRDKGAEQGAVLARVAASHLRIGTFQFFAARGEIDKVRQLADYTIRRHFPDIEGQAEPYLELFRRVRDLQAALVAQWVLVGFVHGVLNTDNTAISGETIDYGPCAFIDAYDPQAVFSSIDQRGRYALGNQPVILQWNLSRFAETLIELVNPADSEDAIRRLTNEVNAFAPRYQAAWLKGMRAKLGLFKELPGDLDLANDLLSGTLGQGVDYTRLFRALGAMVRGNVQPARALFADPAGFDLWLERYLRRMRDEDIPEVRRADAMDRVNPLYIPRNHLVDAALKAASAGDMAPFDRLAKVLSDPFTPQKGAEDYARPAPDSFGKFVTYCGT